MTPCPECGSELLTWRRPDPSDPEEVEPAAQCRNAACSYGY